MSWYKVYFLDERDKIASVENLECESDAIAMGLARQASAGRPNFPGYELWQADRRIEKNSRDGSVQP
jgi:hypothetical protein